MSEFKEYDRVQKAELRNVTQKDLDTLDGGRITFETGNSYNVVSVSQEDRIAGSPMIGDMIARNPKNYHDQWLVAEQYFNDNFEVVLEIQKSEDELLEEKTERNSNVISDFMEHCKQNGIEIPATVFESYFNA